MTTKPKAPAGTLTIERVRDVPELTERWTARYTNDLDPVVIERDHAGTFVSVRWTTRDYVQNNIWDHTRMLADQLGLRYVGPGRETPAEAAQVKPGWMVWAPGLPGGRWLLVAEVHDRVSVPQGLSFRRIVTTLGQKLTVGVSDGVRVRKPVGGAK